MSELRYTDEEIAAIFRSAADDRQIVGGQLPRESGQRLIAIDPVCAGRSTRRKPRREPFRRCE